MTDHSEVGQRGSEHPRKSSGKAASSRKRAAKCAAQPESGQKSLDLTLAKALLARLTPLERQQLLGDLAQGD